LATWARDFTDEEEAALESWRRESNPGSDGRGSWANDEEQARFLSTRGEPC